MSMSLERRIAKIQFSSKQRYRFYLKLATYLEYGVSLDSGLEKMYAIESRDGTKKSEPLAIILADVRRKVQSGHGLALGLKQWIPDSEWSMIDAGQHGGSLSVALKSIVRTGGAISKLRQEVVASLVYPVLIVLGAFAISYFFAISVFPELGKVIPLDEWQGPAGFSAMMAKFIKATAVYFAVIFLVVVSLITYSMPRWTGQMRVKLDQVPPWSIYRLFTGCMFMLSLASLVEAGASVPEALGRLRQTRNRWLAERVTATLKQVQQGASNPGVALKRTGFGFPDQRVIDDLTVYGELPDFQIMLVKIGEDVLDETIDKIKGQAGTAKTVAMFVGFLMVVTLYQGIFGFTQQIQNLQ